MSIATLCDECGEIICKGNAGNDEAFGSFGGVMPPVIKIRFTPWVYQISYNVNRYKAGETKGELEAVGVHLCDKCLVDIVTNGEIKKP